MDLQTEYTKRHNLNVVAATPDSYLLFKADENLHVVFFAHPPRTAHYCDQCGCNKMAIEISRIRKDGISVYYHEHINADEDVVQKIKNATYELRNSKIELIRYISEEENLTLVWKSLGGKGKNTKLEILENIKDISDDKISTIFALENIMNTLNFRKSPLLFDATKDI